MDYTIREARRKDMPQVILLINELAKHENAAEQVEISVEDLEKEGFDNGNFKCFVAEVEDKIVGMALAYFRFSTWKGRTVHLEDLIVTESHRGTGLGKALYQRVVKYGYDHDVKRVEWVVSEGNTNAIKFYENSGANIKKNWYTVHMSENVIKKKIQEYNE